MRLTMTMTGADALNARLTAAGAEISKQVVTRATYEVQNEIKLNLQGKVLDVRTGGLLRAWSQPPVISQENGETVGFLRANSPYAKIHEDGGVVRPTGGRRFLTIPMRAAKTAAGLPAFRAYEVFQNPGAYGFRYTWINKAKTAILGVGKGKNAPVKALFLLRTSVTIPARHYVSDALDVVRRKLPEMLEAVTLRVARAMGLFRQGS